MLLRSVNKLVLIFCLLSQCAIIQAQDKRFIYIQTENNQPFYVRINGKLYSSTASGYVILPKLDATDYQLNIGFPKNEFPEEAYQISVANHNEGFLLKNLGNKWSLFNIETMALVDGVSTQPDVEVKIQTDPFSSMLADVVKDSSLVKERVVVEPKKAETLKTDTAKEITANTVEEKPVENISNTVADSTEILSGITTTHVETVKEKPASIKRILLMNEAKGLELVYVDMAIGDTIRLFMPVSANNNTPKERPKIIYQPEQKDTSSYTITPTIVTGPEYGVKDSRRMEPEKKQEIAPKQDKIIYNPEDSPKSNEDVNQLKEERTDTPEVIQYSHVNSDCVHFATNNDFLKLRKRMAAETDNDKMLDVARKYFKNRCFSTEQIRNLSYLFLDDEGKYRFFDLAYAFTSDSDQYYKLEGQLKDDYYINRFKAMIQK